MDDEIWENDDDILNGKYEGDEEWEGNVGGSHTNARLQSCFIWLKVV